MKTELAVALIAGAVALASGAGTIWSSITNARHSDAIEQLKLDAEQLKEAAKRQREISNYSEPLARSAYDLQSRFYNILKQNLVGVYLVSGNEREQSYVVDNTAFLIAQYLCWTELVRREIQFIPLKTNDQTSQLVHLQDSISDLWGTDKKQGPLFRIFAGEQRAIGEALVQTGTHGPECMGYGTFLRTFNTEQISKGRNPLIDATKNDVLSLGKNQNQASERLTNLRHALRDLVKMLDPKYLEFPED